jgi:hypothetical protein
MTPSLHDLAALSGILVKMNINGKQIADMWLDGDLQGVVHYYEYDALTTYLAWLRIAHFGGFFSREAYDEEQERVRILVAEKSQYPRYEHLIAYQQEWDRLRAAVQSMRINGKPTD